MSTRTNDLFWILWYKTQVASSVAVKFDLARIDVNGWKKLRAHILIILHVRILFYVSHWTNSLKRRSFDRTLPWWILRPVQDWFICSICKNREKMSQRNGNTDWKQYEAHISSRNMGKMIGSKRFLTGSRILQSNPGLPGVYKFNHGTTVQA